MQLTVRPCPATCVENELVRLDRGWTDHPVSWRTHDSTTRFDESTQGDSYVLTMSRVFRAADTKHYYVGIQASVPPQRAAEAQKVVNDIYTQTSGQ
jgi:hypothetical protein